MDLKALREEFGNLKNEADTLLTIIATEKRVMTAEEKEANGRRYSRLDQITALVEEQARLAKYAFAAGEVEAPAAPAGRQEFETQNGGAIKFDADKYKLAVNQYAQTGDRTAAMRFAVTTSTDSGVLLPKDVLPPVEVRRNQNAIRKVLGFYGLNTIQRTVSASISLPISDDTSNVGQQQAEGATTGTTADPNFGSSVTLNPVLYSSKQLWFSNTQVSAVDFDVFSYAMPVLQKRIDKSQESAWTTTLLTGNVGKTTAAPAAMTYQELLDWEHSLPVAYRSDAAFILSDSLYQAIRGLVDNNNRPVMDTDPTNVFQQRIHGKPIAVSDYVPTVAAAHKAGAFVSAEALKVLDVLNTRIARYVLVPSNPDQTGFELFQNGDFNFDPNGVRLLAFAAS